MRALNLPFDAVRLRLRVERVVDLGVLTIGLGLGRLLVAGRVGAAAAPPRACVACARSEIAEATLTGAAAGLARPCEADARADVEAGVATWPGSSPPGAAARRAPPARRCRLGRDRLDLGDGRVRRSAWAARAAWAASAFFFSSCTATEIARRRSSRFCATATRPTASPTWSPTEMMTVGNRKDYSPLC